MDARNIPIPQPCPARWEAMEGDEKRRFCRECKKSVHDLTAMAEDEAQSFVAAHPTACLRYTFDRRTGAILHKGAGCGRARVRIAARKTGAMAALGLALASPALAAPAVESDWTSWLQERVVAVGVWLGIVEPEPPEPPPELITLGGAVVLPVEPPVEPPTETVMGR